jgi:hypothetical protein
MVIQESIDTVEDGARELASVPMLLGVAAVLSSGAIISSYMGLFGSRSNLVRNVGLGVFASALVGYAARGDTLFEGEMSRGVQAFSGTLGLLAFAQLLRNIRSHGFLAEGDISDIVYPSGDGSVIGQTTSTTTTDPLGQQAGASTPNDLFQEQIDYRHEYEVVDYRDLGQYNPLDSHRADIGHAPPVWMAETVPTIHQNPMIVDAAALEPTGKSADPFASYILPSIMMNSAGYSGHGVIENFGAEYGRMGNHVNGSIGNGSVMGQ